jgi:hypothetical protein
VSARKIRMTAVGLVAMPGDRDERTVCADMLASDPLLCTAWAELSALFVRVQTETEDGARKAEGYDAADRWAEQRDGIEAAWDAAIHDAHLNNLDRVRIGLTRARAFAAAAGLDTTHEDAVLAMLPPVVPS